jgi:hypothetical protein
MADNTVSNKPKFRNDLTADKVRQILDYDPETGFFQWKTANATNVKIGDRAGNKRKSKGKFRWVICILGTQYMANRIAWLYQTGKWPENQVDHIDNDQMNNKWKNLREATTAQNCQNQGIRKSNTSGFKGVSRIKKTGRWLAQISVGGKSKCIGTFATPEEAHKAYCDFAEKLHGEFAKFR